MTKIVHNISIIYRDIKISFMNNIPIGNEFYAVSRCGIIPYHKLNDDEYLLLLSKKEFDHAYKYSDFGGGIRSTETCIEGLYREVFTNGFYRAFRSKDLIDATKDSSEGVIRFARKIKSTRNIVHLEWLVPIDFERGNKCIQKCKTACMNLEWVKISRSNNFKCELDLFDENLRAMIPLIAKKL